MNTVRIESREKAWMKIPRVCFCDQAVALMPALFNLKRLALVLTCLTVSLCEGAISWTATGIVDKNGNKPKTGAFVGYFVPTRTDKSGTIIDRQSFIEFLQSGEYGYDLPYMVGQAFNMTSARMCKMSSDPWIDESLSLSTVTGFAVIFNSDMVETATAFFVTDEVSEYVGNMAIGSEVNFDFGSQAEALWQQISPGGGTAYSITFDIGEHGEFSDPQELGYRETYLYDDIFSSGDVPEITAHDGWRFIGWRDISADLFYPAGSDVTVAGDSYFKAEYEEIPVVITYAVSFDLGEHGIRTGGGELTQTVTNGWAAVAPTVTASQGWEFMGWATASGGAVAYGSGAVISPAADITLYAVWKLHIAVSRNAVTFGANAGTDSVSVETGEEDGEWAATANANWLTITKTGNNLRITATANITTSMRTATITISTTNALYTATITVRQSRATAYLEVSPSQTSFPNSGGTGSVSVSANSGWNAVAWDDDLDDECDWICLFYFDGTGSGDSAWVDGTGDGSFMFTVSENTTSEPRSATIYVNCGSVVQSLTVSQSTSSVTPEESPVGPVEPPVGDGIALSADSATLSDGAASMVTFSVEGIAEWAVEELEDWLEIVTLQGVTAGLAERLDDSRWISHGHINTVYVNVAENLTGEARIGYVNVRDDFGNEAVFTITQPSNAVMPPAPLPPALSEMDATVGCEAGDYSFGVVCDTAWSVEIRDADWVTVRQTAVGVEYAVTANASILPRTAEIVVSGTDGTESQTFTLTQEGSPCMLELSETEAAVGCGGAAGNIEVVCNGEWSAATSAEWVTLVCDMASSNIEYTVASNATYNTRMAQITVACGSTQTVFFISQEGAPPGQVEFLYGGGYGDMLGRLWGVVLNGNKTIAIPDGIIEIYDNALENLPLESVIVPATVDRIGAMSFSGCSSLNTIVFLGNAPTEGIDATAFKGITGGRVLINRAATGFVVDAKGRLKGTSMTVVYYGNAVEDGTMAATADGGYVVTANDGKTLTDADFSFSTVVDDEVVDTRKGYVVAIADGGKRATVQLRNPAIGAMSVNEGVIDATDKSGALVVVPESKIAGKPAAVGEEDVGALPVEAVPGLYYQASWGNNLDSLSSGAKVQAKTDTLYLGVIKQTGDKGFYRVTVSEQ